jgi:hypothetical protein
MPNPTPSPVRENTKRDMTISITDPSANEVMGMSFTVQGNYSCPVGNPTFLCSLARAPSDDGGAAKIQPLYLTSATSTWEAYFTGVVPGNYTVTGTISHPGASVSTPAVPISVSGSPGVTVSSPAQGNTIPFGTCTVIGTVDPAYLSGYTVQVSLMGNGVTCGGPVNATPDQSGNWSVDLPVESGLSGDANMSVQVILLKSGTTTSICELAVGNLSIQ